MCTAGQPSELALVDPIKAAGPATCTVGKHDASVQSSTEFSKRLEETEAACQAAEQLVEQLKKDNDAWNKRVGRLQHLQQLRMLPSNVMQPEDTHQEANISYSATKGQQNSRSPQCFHCEEYGHIARNCCRRLGGSKQKNKPVGAKPSSGSSKCVNQASGGGRESAAVVAAYLNMQIDRQSCECLLDTGSDVTLIPATLIKDEPIQSSTYVLKAANGTEIPILGEVSLAFKLGGYTGSISGLASEHVSEVILGINWLTCHSVTLVKPGSG